MFVSKLQADVDNSGTIDYKEFIAATLHLHKVEKEDHLFAAFSYFDKDDSGYITIDELQQACNEFGMDDVHLEEMIREVDQDNVSTSLLLRCFHQLKKLFSISKNILVTCVCACVSVLD
jgi:calcium-dependent protein kinase